jgi:hypothetical protein
MKITKAAAGFAIAAAAAFAPIAASPVASADQCDDAFAGIGGPSLPQFGYGQCEIDLHKMQTPPVGTPSDNLCRAARATGATPPPGSNCPP